MYVGTLLSYGARRVKAHCQFAVPVGQIGCFCHGVPSFDVCLRETVLVVHVLPFFSSAVEGHAENHFAIGDSCLAMCLDGFGGTEPTDVWRAVECRVVFGRVAHVVGHHVDHIEILHTGAEVDELCAAHTCQSEPEFLSQSLPEVAHQEGEVFGVFGRRTDAGTVLRGVFPVDVDAVDAEFIAQASAIFGKGLSVCLVGSHLAEPATAPPAYAQHDAEVAVFFL